MAIFFLMFLYRMKSHNTCCFISRVKYKNPGEWQLWYRLSLVLVLKPTLRAHNRGILNVIQIGVLKAAVGVTRPFYLRYSKIWNRLTCSSSCYSPFMVFVILVLEAECKVWCYLTGQCGCLFAGSHSFPCVIMYVTIIHVECPAIILHWWF